MRSEGRREWFFVLQKEVGGYKNLAHSVAGIKVLVAVIHRDSNALLFLSVAPRM
jgi:hypothetical protein